MGWLHGNGFAFGRGQDEVTVALNAMSRSGKPDVYLIEAFGTVSPDHDRFMMRVEGYLQKGKMLQRITIMRKKPTNRKVKAVNPYWMPITL